MGLGTNWYENKTTGSNSEGMGVVFDGMGGGVLKKEKLVLAFISHLKTAILFYFFFNVFYPFKIEYYHFSKTVYYVIW